MKKEYPGGCAVLWYDGEGCSGANMERTKNEDIDQSLIYNAYNVSTKASLDTEEGVQELQQVMLRTRELEEQRRKKERQEIQKQCKAKGLPIPRNFNDEFKMVLVLDGITNLTGAAEENNAKEGARHIVLITKMLQSFDWDIKPAAIVITHSTKDCYKMNTGNTLTEPTPADARGSGNIMGNVRCCIALTHGGAKHADTRIAWNICNSFNPQGLLDPFAFEKDEETGKVKQVDMPPKNQPKARVPTPV